VKRPGSLTIDELSTSWLMTRRRVSREQVGDFIERGQRAEDRCRALERRERILTRINQVLTVTVAALMFVMIALVTRFQQQQ
jgi:predicted nucleic acid-binding Zn ribbon protein